MLKLPFKSRTTATNSAWLLWKAFTYHSVKMLGADSNPTDIPLYQTKQCLAVALGFLNWAQLIKYVEKNKSNVTNGEENYVALAMNLERCLKVRGEFEQIFLALRMCCIWDANENRKMMNEFFKNLPCKTRKQWGALQQIDSTYQYHTRYKQDWSDKDIAAFEKWRHHARVKVMKDYS